MSIHTSDRNSTRKEVALSVILFVITVSFFIGIIWISIERVLIAIEENRDMLFWVSNTAYMGIISIFAYSTLLYQISRIGYYTRLNSPNTLVKTCEANRYAIKNTRELPSLSVLVPAYKEDVRSVRQTLFSAALLGYSKKHVVLLLDDPVGSGNTRVPASTEQTLPMVKEVNTELATQHDEFNARCDAIEQSLPQLTSEPANVITALAALYEDISLWFHTALQSQEASDHTDTLFRNKVLDEPAQFYRQKAVSLKRVARQKRPEEQFDASQVLKELHFIRSLFDVKIAVFQRKRFDNVSHDPNKAMNLNTYLSLMGSSYYVDRLGDKLTLTSYPISHNCGRLTFPSSDYVITLDADSILDHHYAAKLIYKMQRPECRDIAIMQTPYSAIPKPKSVLERTAGITTDIQYILHQGFTGCNAAYWVGANALIRMSALQELREDMAGQTIVKRFIQDRTVIEDTESSIDLINNGWKLYNYPERLSYSATPPDYGSLVVQRRRWANGGLIILPKLLWYLIRRPRLRKIPEGFLRLHYLVSIFLINAGLFLMLFIPIDNYIFSLLFIFIAISYFYLYYRDMRSLQYGLTDLLRVYAFNLILIPIHTGGVLKSIYQILSGRKCPFGRTPKTPERTAAPVVYHVVTYGLIAGLGLLAFDHLAQAHYIFAVTILANTMLLAYGAMIFIGFKNSLEDIRLKFSRQNKK